MILVMDILSAFLIGALGGMGVGGGTLLVIYLTLVHGTGQLVTQGSNLLFFLFSAGAALPIHLKRRKLPLMKLAICILGALPTAVLGSYLSGVIPEETIRTLFAFLLIFSGIAVLVRPSQEKNGKKFSAFSKK